MWEQKHLGSNPGHMAQLRCSVRPACVQPVMTDQRLYGLCVYSFVSMVSVSLMVSLSLYLPLQVDPSFAYAYTLLGHEFVLTEELDKALSCFRNAIRVNTRHYNAW